MSEDTTLETFLTDEPPAAEIDEEPGEPDSDEAVVPASPTYGWGEYVCGECGDATERVWMRESGVVCPACVEW